MSAFVSAPYTFAHANDVNFRDWVGAVHAGMLTAGWAATTDTGQLDPVTAIRPTVISTYAGARTYRLDDPLASTDPIFVQLRFGTGATVTNPALTVQVSNATNGANLLTGNVAPASVTLFANQPFNAPSYIGGCTRDGFGCLWIAHANAAAGSDGIGFFITREHDTADLPVGGRYSVVTLASGASGAVLSCTGINNDFGPAAVFAGGSSTCMVGGNQANSPNVNTIELYRHVAPLPESTVIPSLLTYRSSEITRYTLFDAVPGAAANRTYKALGFKGASVTGGATHALAVWHE